MELERRFLSLKSASRTSNGEIVVEILHSEIPILVVEVALLLYGLAETLRLHPVSGPSALLTLQPGDQVSRAIVERSRDGAFKFALGHNQAGFLQATLLRAYRDHMAETDHIHIEGLEGAAPFDLTIRFELAREPMSPEEAKRLMGD